MKVECEYAKAIQKFCLSCASKINIYTLQYLLLLIGLIPQLLFSQNQINNWFFGDSLMMNFSGSEPETYQLYSDSLLPVQEASASISDEEGNLLFYTNGKYLG